MSSGGGGGFFSKAKKAVKKAKDDVGDVYEDVIHPDSAKDFTKSLSWLYNPYGKAGKEGAVQAGAKPDTAGAFFDTGGEASGAIAKKFIDDPTRLKREQGRLAHEAGVAQEAQLKKLRDREAQEGAEDEAGKNLERRRRKQKERRRKAKGGSSGHKGTILTDSLGSTGGEESKQGKTLLGR